MKKIDRTKAGYFILAAFVVALFLFFSYSRVFDEFEYSTFDLRYKLRAPQSADKNIVIIQVDDTSIEEIGEWPFPRKFHTLLVKALKSAGARTVIFDIFFSEPKEGDEEFAAAVKEAGNVYMPYVFQLETEKRDATRVHASGYAAPLLEVFKKAAKGTGFINVEPDIDGKIRRIPSFIEYRDVFYPHLTVLAALNNSGYGFENVRIMPGRAMIAGEDIVIPLDGGSSVLVDYPAVWGKAFRHYSYIDVLQSYLSDLTGKEAAVDLKKFKDSICFIGLTATAAPDVHPSPLEPLYPGVGVHASVYNSIIEKSFLRRLGRWWNLLLLVIMWAVTAYLTSKARKRFAILSILGVIVLYVIAAALLFWPFGVWIDVFYPLVTMVIVYIIFTFRKYIAEIQKREIIEKELDIARNIQESFLPKQLPRVGDMDVAVDMITARQVGGDLYDVLQLGDKRLGVMIGDVSGKGVPAALYMARVVSVFKAFALSEEVDAVIKNTNRRLIAESDSGLFVTLAYMVFDAVTNSAVYAIGGHMPTMMIGPDGKVELLDVEEGMPLGMIEGNFSLGRCEYRPESIFLFYTDGVTEAMNTRGEMFGGERLKELAAGLKGCSAGEVVSAVHKAVADFAGKAKQHDDITVLAVKV